MVNRQISNATFSDNVLLLRLLWAFSIPTVVLVTFTIEGRVIEKAGKSLPRLQGHACRDACKEEFLESARRHP